MKKRGPLIGFIGVGVTTASFLAVFAIFPIDSTFSGEILLSNVFEDMFNQISAQTIIYPQESTSFSYSSIKSDVPLLWGIQIIDFQQGDKFLVSVSNMFGDNFGTFEIGDPYFFEMFTIPKNDIYNFDVTNTSNRPIIVIMMFSEDPDNAQALSDPNSPVMNTLIPLAITAIVLVIGIIMIIIGAIITTIDWKREKDQKSRMFRD